MDKKSIISEYHRRLAELGSEYRERHRIIRQDYERQLEEYYLEHPEQRPKDPPKRSIIEEVGNAVSHGVGAIFAIVAFFLMIFNAGDGLERLSAVIYFIGLGVMFTISCLYHSFRHGLAVKRVFRRFDYSSIYLLIGATFAPILLSYVQNRPLGIAFFVIQWVVIVTGITLVGVFGPARLRFIHIPLYVILGWCGLMFVPEMIMRGDYLFLGMIIGGGVIYSIGIVPYALKKKASHFIWHFFVLAGAVVQWIGVFIQIYIN